MIDERLKKIEMKLDLLLSLLQPKNEEVDELVKLAAKTNNSKERHELLLKAIQISNAKRGV